jgi:hypothetical protein
VSQSNEGTLEVIARPLGAGSPPALIVLNPSSESFSVLGRAGTGGFLNPQPDLTYSTGGHPVAFAAGRFTSSPELDLAVLNQDSHSISIFLGDGKGGFRKTFTIDAGNQPTGLTAFDIDGDGILDLLVSNEFGDVLVLPGNGDGTFRTYQRLDGTITLAVAGQDHLVFGNKAKDHIAVKDASGVLDFSQGRADGILAPGAVQTANVGNGVQALVAANSGANNVLVYLGRGGQFDPNTVQTFPAGTDPVGIAITDVNGDGIPDVLAANQGSNDVTVLLGQGTGMQWTLTSGPRLNANGVGPVSTTVADVTGPNGRPDGIPDLLIANSQSNDVAVLPGVGLGFFDDGHARLFDTGVDPRQVLVGQFDTNGGLDMVSINAGSNDLTFFPNFGSPQSISSGGQVPVAAVEVTQQGRTDLVVVNNGNGVIGVLTESPDGPELIEAFTRATVPHPTDVALGNDPSVFFVSSEGEESATRFTLSVANGQEQESAAPFALNFGVAVPSALASGLTGPTPEQRIADLFPLEGSSLATVATLVSIGAEGTGEGHPTGEGATAQTDVILGMLVGVVANVNSGGESDNPNPADKSEPTTDTAASKEAEGSEGLFELDELLRRSAEELRQKESSGGTMPPSAEPMKPVPEELPPDVHPASGGGKSPDDAAAWPGLESSKAPAQSPPGFPKSPTPATRYALAKSSRLSGNSTQANDCEYCVETEILAAALLACGLYLPFSPTSLICTSPPGLPQAWRSSRSLRAT